MCWEPLLCQCYNVRARDLDSQIFSYSFLRYSKKQLCYMVPVRVYAFVFFFFKVNQVAKWWRKQHIFVIDDGGNKTTR